MKTTATNRKVRELLTALRHKKLVPRPDFQRRLVWNNKDKSAFLETVLLSYPFPEIYVAAGEVDVETGEGTELLVDGQQRVTTLNQYFTASPDLVLYGQVKPYADLSKDEKEAFLQYDVVVRDLGRVDLDVVKSVFQRINATKYALNAMEVHNARYEGQFKEFAEQFAQRPFFEVHHLFSATEIRRMHDVRFAVTIAASVLSTYFHRDDAIEDFLSRYNDEFPMRFDLEKELDLTLEFIEGMGSPETSRIWKKADLLTAIVELHAALFKRQWKLDAVKVSKAFEEFFMQVDDPDARGPSDSPAAMYHKAAFQGTNDRGNRITRGEILRGVIRSAL